VPTIVTGILPKDFLMPTLTGVDVLAIPGFHASTLMGNLFILREIPLRVRQTDSLPGR